MSYNVFISWSGPVSRAIGIALRDLLPYLNPQCVPWMSDADLQKGAVWPKDLLDQLSAVQVGIVVVTQQNLQSNWMLFEAGVLYRSIDQPRVCTLLCGIEPPLIGPLGLFQATTATKSEFLKLLSSIASRIPLPSTLNQHKLMEQHWPDLESRITSALASQPKASLESGQPPQSDPLSREILTTVQRLSRQTEHLAQMISKGQSRSHSHASPRNVTNSTLQHHGPFPEAWVEYCGAGSYLPGRFSPQARESLERFALRYPDETRHAVFVWMNSHVSLAEAYTIEPGALPGTLRVGPFDFSVRAETDESQEDVRFRNIRVVDSVVLARPPGETLDTPIR